MNWCRESLGTRQRSRCACGSGTPGISFARRLRAAPARPKAPAAVSTLPAASAGCLRQAISLRSVRVLVSASRRDELS
jgi:hypothetical protein